MWLEVTIIGILILVSYGMILFFVVSSIKVAYTKTDSELLKHHEAMTVMMQQLIDVFIQVNGGTLSQEGQDIMSMGCPFADKNDPDKILCKNESNVTGLCETKYCPFIS